MKELREKRINDFTALGKEIQIDGETLRPDTRISDSTLDKELQNSIDDITSFYKEKGKSKAFINNEVDIKKLSHQIKKAQESGDDDLVVDLRKKIDPLLSLRREY